MSRSAMFYFRTET